MAALFLALLTASKHIAPAVSVIEADGCLVNRVL